MRLIIILIVKIIKLMIMVIIMIIVTILMIIMVIGHDSALTSIHEVEYEAEFDYNIDHHNNR